MPTPKIDNIAIEFLKKIPDVFQTAFTAGTEMPDAEVLSKNEIMDYVNRALHKYFNDVWSGVAKTVPSMQKQKERFIQILPELTGIMNATTLPTGIENYRDFYDVINGFLGNSEKTFIRVWTSDKLGVISSTKLKKYTPTEKSPVIIKVQNLEQIILDISPITLYGQPATFIYIKFPIDRTNGGFLVQNGDYDSPFHETRHPDIVQIAFDLYLQDTQQTE